MLPYWIRVISDLDSTLTDISIASQKESSDVDVSLKSSDYLYIGQYYPFNNLYFKMSSNVNSVSSTASIEYWDGTEWYSAVDVLDDTLSSGATLGQSGILMWSPDRNRAWNYVADTSETSGTPTELRNFTIYDLYWARISVSDNLSDSVDLDRLGYFFTAEAMLPDLDPDINEYLTSWLTGKTDWKDQIMVASNHVILDLKNRGLVRSGSEILRFDELYLSTAYRTLAVIYDGLGKKFADKKKEAMAEYKKIMDNIKFTLDNDSNARVTRDEVSSTMGVIVR